MQFPEEAMHSADELRERRYKKLGKFGELALALRADIANDPGVVWSDTYPAKGFNTSSTVFSRYLDFLNDSKGKLPNHATFFNKVLFELQHNSSHYKLTYAKEAIDYIIDMLLLEEGFKGKSEDLKLFKSADDKIKEAAVGFKEQDWNGSLNDLNTALELLLKERLSIPSTITDIHTGWIIDFLVKINKGPTRFLTEAKNKICRFDNKVKHTGYSPDKIDCVNAIKAIEELRRELESSKINLTADEEKELFKGI
ncbi:MAG: hypothetical protein ACYCO0_05080 [Candidatus Micrarchaeaceae archaeon]